jgi:hypothetical protein
MCLHGQAADPFRAGILDQAPEGCLVHGQTLQDPVRTVMPLIERAECRNRCRAAGVAWGEPHEVVPPPGTLSQGRRSLGYP